MESTRLQPAKVLYAAAKQHTFLEVVSMNGGNRLRRWLALAPIVSVGCSAPPHVGSPDLYVVRPAPGYCRIVDAGGTKFLQVTVSNQGAAFEAPSTGIAIKVSFSAREGYPGSNRSETIPSGFTFSTGLEYEQDFEVPLEAYRPDLFFTITVDDTNVVDESNESNNTVSGVCAG
jgi:hypothetical protein